MQQESLDIQDGRDTREVSQNRIIDGISECYLIEEHFSIRLF